VNRLAGPVVKAGIDATRANTRIPLIPAIHAGGARVRQPEDRL